MTVTLDRDTGDYLVSREGTYVGYVGRLDDGTWYASRYVGQATGHRWTGGSYGRRRDAVLALGFTMGERPTDCPNGSRADCSPACDRIHAGESGHTGMRLRGEVTS